MAVITSVVCHTQGEFFLTNTNKKFKFEEGEVYMAHAFSEDIIDIYENENMNFMQLNSNEFFMNFMTIEFAKNSEEFYKIISPKEKEITNKFNNLLILKQWQNKNKKQRNSLKQRILSQI